PDESWSFATSDQGSGYKVYENFWDLPGGPIGDIHWWGMALIWTGFGWENGDPSNLVFDITFYSDPPDDPNLPPTEVACTYVDVVPSYVYYDLYAGYYNCYFFSFDTLDPSCDLVEGWVSIESKSPGEGYDWFLWGSAKTGDGMSCQEGGDCPRWYDQAFILTEGAPACPFTVTPEADTVPPGEYTDLLLTFDGTLFTECVDESMVCYLVITSNDCDEPVVTADVHATSARGDLNGDCLINIEDVVYLLNYIFVSGPAPTPECMADVDRDGDVDSDDALYLLSYLFTGGPPPDVPTAPKEGETIEMKTIRPIKQTPIQRK
ncbi:MAG: dockerin type I domain-containing protein, partial [Candidatus Zixiibacteriota bacterium]